MNWKKFLKPDWRKIVLSIILFILFGFLIYINVSSCFGYRILCEEDYVPYYGSFIECGGTECIPNKLAFFYQIKDLTLLLFVLFILPYLLSCFGVQIYDKVKKK